MLGNVFKHNKNKGTGYKNIKLPFKYKTCKNCKLLRDSQQNLGWYQCKERSSMEFNYEVITKNGCPDFEPKPSTYKKYEEDLIKEKEEQKRKLEDKLTHKQELTHQEETKIRKRTQAKENVWRRVKLKRSDVEEFQNKCKYCSKFESATKHSYAFCREGRKKTVYAEETNDCTVFKLDKYYEDFCKKQKYKGL